MNFNYISNKKALSEITSFILILLVITTLSIGIYLYINSEIETQIAQQDLIKVEKQLIKLSKIMDFVENNPRLSESSILSFYKGNLFISSSQIRYISEIKNSYDSTICVDLCYESYFGFESFYINISNTTNSINLSQELIPGTYVLTTSYDDNSNFFQIGIE